MPDTRKNHAVRGQVLTEYAIMLAVFVMISMVFLFLFAAFSQYGWRMLSLVAWEPYT